MLATLLKLLREKVNQLALGALTSGSCMVPEAPAQIPPQLLATTFGHSSVTPALLPAGTSETSGDVRDRDISSSGCPAALCWVCSCHTQLTVPCHPGAAMGTRHCQAS